MSGVVRTIFVTPIQTAGAFVWNKTQAAAQGLYDTANRGWQWLPEGGIRGAVQDTWNNAPEGTAMRVAGVCGATITGAAMATATAVAAPPLVAIGVGIGAAGFLWSKSDSKTSLKVAGAVTAGAAAFAIVPVASAAAAIGTGITVLMAAHPGGLLLINRVGLPPIEIGGAEPDPEPLVSLETNLRELEKLSAKFRAEHPPEMFAALKESTHKMDPQLEWDLQKQRMQTNAAKDRLVANIAAYTSVSFIFVRRLGLPMESRDGVDIIMQIAEVASKPSDGKYPNLWDTCMDCLKANGVRLTPIQWIRAKFWYFLSDVIGIVPNTFKEIGDSVLKAFRGGVQQEQLPVDIARCIAIADSFLEKYKSATKQYADAGEPGHPPNLGNLSDYQRSMINELGEACLVERAKSHWQPGQDLGKIIIQDLCKEFVEAVVNDPKLFPPIPFFKNLQNLSCKGIRIGAVFDIFAWLFGGMLNWIGKKFIQAYAPAVMQDIVKIGLNQAMPGTFSFKIAVANALKGQIEVLDTQFEHGVPSQPIRFTKNRQLNDLISKLLETLELTACRGNAAALRHKFRAFEERENPALANNQQLEEARKNNQLLNAAVIEGAQFLIEYYTKNPEALEQLFEQLFALSNEVFSSEARVDTAEQFHHAADSFQNAVKTFIGKLVEKAVHEIAHGEDDATIGYIFKGIDLDIAARNDPANPGRIVIHRQGIFNEHKEKAKETAQLLAGLALKMSKELQADRDVSIAPAPQQPVMRVSNEEARQIAEAKANYDNAQKKVRKMQARFDLARGADLPEAQFKLTTAKNEYEQAGLELEIVKERVRVTQEVARLTTLVATIKAEIVRVENNPAGWVEARKKLKDAKMKLGYAKEEQAPGLIEARIQFNGLKRPCDHWLKDLDHFEQIINRFAEHIKSINIDLYHKFVPSIFNKTFGRTHHRVVGLTKQLSDLQTLGKSYDKAKRLSELFLDIERTVTKSLDQDSPPQQELVNAFHLKLDAIQEVENSFRKYDENPGENVTPFHKLIKELEPITKAYATKGTILRQLKTLGRPDQLGQAVLTYPKQFGQELRAKVPEEDREPLFSLIAQLRTQGELTPRPDLRSLHAAIAAKFTAIVQKYQTQKRQQLGLGIAKHSEIQAWVQGRLRDTTNRRNHYRIELAKKLDVLQRDTKELVSKVEQVEFRPPVLGNRRVAPFVPGLPGYLNGIRDQNAHMIVNLTDSAYEFLTSEQVPEAITRLTLGEVIRAHRR